MHVQQDFIFHCWVRRKNWVVLHTILSGPIIQSDINLEEVPEPTRILAAASEISASENDQMEDNMSIVS